MVIEAIRRRLRGSESPSRTPSILASFCNTNYPGSPSLAVISGEDVQLIKIKHGVHIMGCTGLCHYRDGLICVVHQGTRELPSGFVILDPKKDFAQVSEGILGSHELDPHSVCSDGESLYVAITGRDSVWKVNFGRRGMWRTEVFWTHPESTGERDERHINGVTFADGDLLVSGFERKDSGGWESAKRGFVYNASRQEYVLRDLQHPHSPQSDPMSSSVWVCESARNVLTSTTGDRIELPGTYLRGLAFDGDAFYTASSKRRMFSKSEDGDGAYEGTCGLYRTSGAPLGAPRETEMIAEFHDRTAEIYDLLILPQR